MYSVSRFVSNASLLTSDTSLFQNLAFSLSTLFVFSCAGRLLGKPVLLEGQDEFGRRLHCNAQTGTAYLLGGSGGVWKVMFRSKDGAERLSVQPAAVKLPESCLWASSNSRYVFALSPRFRLYALSNERCDLLDSECERHSHNQIPHSTHAPRAVQ